MIVIIGGGLAGLTCARCLEQAGQNYLLLEASPNLGGRLSTEVTSDDYRLDRGFQVLLESYDLLGRYIKLSDLKPRYFDSGAILEDNGEFHRIYHPLRHPDWLTATALDPWFRADRFRLMQLVKKAVGISDENLLSQCHSAADTSTADFLRRAGISPECFDRFFRPFFGGVFLDDALQTSAGLFLYYLKKFALGRAFIPATGIGAVGPLLAAPIPEAKIRRETGVHELHGSRGRMTYLLTFSGERIDFEHLILATHEPECARLLKDRTTRSHRGVWTFYFSSDLPLYSGASLVLPRRQNSCIQHFVQITNVAPELAPTGRHLLSATVLEERANNPDFGPQLIQYELKKMFPGFVGQLDFLQSVHVPYAVYRQPAGFGMRHKYQSRYENVTLAGDHTTSCSIQQAMVSGEKAAQTYLRARKK